MVCKSLRVFLFHLENTVPCYHLCFISSVLLLTVIILYCLHVYHKSKKLRFLYSTDK
nr:MAG TPA: hypothetical protein [Caudoviricetes sp.]